MSAGLQYPGWSVLASSLRKAAYRDDLPQTDRSLGETKNKSFLQTAEICHSAVLWVNLRFCECYPYLTPRSRISHKNVLLNLTMVHPHSSLCCNASSPSVFRTLLIGAISAQTPAMGTSRSHTDPGTLQAVLAEECGRLLLTTIRHHTSRTGFKYHSTPQTLTSLCPLPSPSSFYNRAHFKYDTILKPHYSDDGEFIRYIQLHMMH